MIVKGVAPSGVWRSTAAALCALAVSLPLSAACASPAAAQTAASLPDGRAWELVSPPDKFGATLEGISREGGLIQAAAGGGSISYVANAPIEAEPQGNPARELTQVLSTRGAQGWSSTGIATPHNGVTGVQAGNPAEYKIFSPDLSLGIVDQVGDDETPLSPQASEKAPYLRDNLSGSYVPLVTAANVPPGAKLGHRGANSGPSVSFVAATPDLSHVVIGASGVALTSTPTPEGGLYEWAEGHLQLVSFLPGNTTAAESPILGENNRSVRHAISDDGLRVFWSGRSAGARHLYMRDMAAKGTVQLDASQGGPPNLGETHEAQFQLASRTGTTVFFTDAERLTAASTASGEAFPPEPDLYECAIVQKSGKPACELRDLTVDHNAGEHANVQGVLPGAGEDASYVYLVAKGVLTATPSQQGEKAQPGADNLYVLHEGAPAFIAVLSGEDEKDWQGEAGDLAEVTSGASPSGLYFAFMSNRNLTGYEPLDANSPPGEPHFDEEVYLYSASSNHLVCASCNPSGARPVGVFDPGGFPGLLVDRPDTWAGHWLAGSIPGWTSTALEEAHYQSRYLSDTGRLFFNSPDALVPADINGKEDVYEYENGAPYLISSGTSGEESAFMDASLSGSDVFFLTAARLTAQDTDDTFDVYDAHECTEASPCVTPPVSSPSSPCTTGVSCRSSSPPESLLSQTPSSVTFSGAGNLASPVAKPTPRRLTRAQQFARALKACRKVPRKQRASCRARAKRRYAPRKGRR